MWSRSTPQATIIVDVKILVTKLHMFEVICPWPQLACFLLILMCNVTVCRFFNIPTHHCSFWKIWMQWKHPNSDTLDWNTVFYLVMCLDLVFSRMITLRTFFPPRSLFRWLYAWKLFSFPRALYVFAQAFSSRKFGIVTEWWQEGMELDPIHIMLKKRWKKKIGFSAVNYWYTQYSIVQYE